MQQQVDALHEAEQYMKRLEGGINTATVCFRNGNTKMGYHLISQISEGLAWLEDVFRLTSEMQKEKIDIGAVRHIISEIVEAIENKDLVLIADLLEFELLIKIDEWMRKTNATIQYYEK